MLVTIGVYLCCIGVIVYCIKASASVLLVIIVRPLIPATTCSSINKQTLRIIMHVDGHYMRTIVVLLVCVCVRVHFHLYWKAYWDFIAECSMI